MRRAAVLAALLTLASTVTVESSAAEGTQVSDPLLDACLVSVNLTDDADCDVLAASGTGNVSASFLAVSGTGSAHGIAVGGISGTGDARGGNPLSGLGTCEGQACFDAAVADDARGHWLAVSVLGDSEGEELVASGTGSARGCGVVLSGTDAARHEGCAWPRSKYALTASGLGEASRAPVAFSATGPAEAEDGCPVHVSVVRVCGGIAVSGTDNASASRQESCWSTDVAVCLLLAGSGTGDGKTHDRSRLGCGSGSLQLCPELAISGTGDASGEHAPASGCQDGSPAMAACEDASAPDASATSSADPSAQDLYDAWLPEGAGIGR